MSDPSQVVIFGASGDLTIRKLIPALASLARKNRPIDGFSVLGVARRPKTDDAWRAELREGMPDDLKSAFDQLAPRIHYMAGDVAEPKDLAALSDKLDTLPGGRATGRLYYLSLKPDLFASTVQNLAKGGLVQVREGEKKAWRRVIVEKPFGHDLPSARSLNHDLHEHLLEEQIYRIDHYLGKETVQNILGFRFHNSIFEPVWNRNHVELVQITAAEDLGMESGRAGYYDGVGALRDMLQNHLLQVLTLVAMEPPASMKAEAVRAEKVAVLRALRVMDPIDVQKHTIRARYTAGEIGGKPVPGYLEEQGVKPGSSTETYVAVRAEIDNWRWSGVPFLVRHGKRLRKKFTEIQVQFKTPPIALFNQPEGMSADEFQRAVRNGSLATMRPNVLTLSLQPRESIQLSFGVKVPGAQMNMAPANLSFDYRDQFGAGTAPAYERLLLDALIGDASLYIRAEETEACWRFADAIIAGWQAPGAPAILDYPAGTLGPHEADSLFYGQLGGWSRG